MRVPVIARAVFVRPKQSPSLCWRLLRQPFGLPRNDEKACIMKRELHPCIYIMTNEYNTVLYTGVTSNIIKRVSEHKNKTVSGFTSKYKVTKLVYYENYPTMPEAIAREKQIKGGSRQKKIDLINRTNPKWTDLYEEFFV